MPSVASRRPARPPSVGSPPRSQQTRPYIEPCDPTLSERAPVGREWLYEIKADGYRAQVHLRDDRVTVYSRRGLDWTQQFQAIADAAKKLNGKDAIIDGEAVVYGGSGVPDFQSLRRELGKRKSGALRYHAFDLLYLDGQDLRRHPYVERKQKLQELLTDAPETFIYVDYLEADGDRVFEHACKMGLEGIVAKRRDSLYRSGRTDSWIKLKCRKSDTYPIVAFVEKLGAQPRKIASLYLGRHEGDAMLYAGKARSGYTEEVARDLRERLDPYIQRESPLTQRIKKPKATWLNPVVEAEIEYSGITDDGLLREAAFKGVRDDLATSPRPTQPPYVSRGAKRSEHGVPRENILQLLPDAVAPSKEQLAAYWRRTAKRALKYLGGRPLKLVRHAHGITFYHKGPLPPIPASVHQLHIEKREGGEGVRVWVDDLNGLLGLIDMDAVELHPWAATVDDIEHPDRLVFDLDPGPGVAWDFVRETAFKLRALLEEEHYESWPKLTGGKGMHVMVPIEPRITHDQARDYCRRMAQAIAATAPDRYTTSSAPQARLNRIYIDYLRNGRGNTAIGAYSPRARRGFPIAAPITWRDVERAIAADAYSFDRIPRR